MNQPPDFTFFFYSPWRSFFAEKPCAFRDGDGNEVKSKRSLSPLFAIASDAATILGAGVIAIETWRQKIEMMRDVLRTIREELPMDRIDFVNSYGLKIEETLTVDDLCPEDIANLMPKSANIEHAEYRKSMQDLWCLICLKKIDSAILTQIFEDAGDGVESIVAAQNALEQARQFGPIQLTIAERGAQARHAKGNRVRTWVQAEWATHSDEYEGNKSAFSRHYVRRVFLEHGVNITEKQMREVWLKDTPSASKPDGLPADGE